MRKSLFLVISIFSLIILFGCSIPEVKKEQQPSPMLEQQEAQSLPGRINSEQPIPIGEIIFSDTWSVFLTPEERRGLNDPDFFDRENIISYTYLGLDDKNNVKVVYYEKSGPLRQPTEKTLLLLLPLNDKKQTILRVKTARPRVPVKRDLLITVVDEFNRITVEETVKTETK